MINRHYFFNVRIYRANKISYASGTITIKSFFVDPVKIFEITMDFVSKENATTQKEIEIITLARLK